MDSTKKREISNEIMKDDKLSVDQKLFLVSQLYKEEMSLQVPLPYYALLAWKDQHLKDLLSGKVMKWMDDLGL